MKELHKCEWIIQRTSEDCCLLCGKLGNYGKGHPFKGKKFIEDYVGEDILIDENKWIYLCGFQICPACFEKLYCSWKKVGS